MTAAIPGGTLKTDPEQLGPIVMDFYATSLERGLAARDRCETSRFIDVSHDDFIDNSLGVAKKIYDRFGLLLGPEVEAAMNTHVEKNPQGKHGSHDYSLEEWGLDAARVRERFAPYIERFEIETG
jgi:hypothetical protein